MFICPVCEKEFKTEKLVRKHFLQCWQEVHPFHKAKPAPQTRNRETREVNEDITNFFSSFGGN